MTTEHDPVRLLLGAYVLGGLNERDRHAFDAHLSTCAECREELAQAAPLPGLLRRLPGTAAFPHLADEAVPFGDSFDPPPAQLDSLLEKVRTERGSRRRTRSRRTLLGLAASVVLAAVVSLTLVLPSHQSGGESTVALSAVATSTTSGQATLTAKPWGTSLAVKLAGLPDRGPFVLQVHGVGGRTEQAATWSTTPTHSATVTGASSMHPADVRSITVLDVDGQVLATATMA